MSTGAIDHSQVEVEEGGTEKVGFDVRTAFPIFETKKSQWKREEGRIPLMSLSQEQLQLLSDQDLSLYMTVKRRICRTMHVAGRRNVNPEG